jgi:hypothetical protein
MPTAENIDLLFHAEQLPADTRLRYRRIADGVYAPVVFAEAELVLVPGDGETPQALLTDDITGALVQIGVVHHEVHEGDTFIVSLASTAIANNANIAILLRTGNSRYGHLSWYVSAGGDAEFEFIESPTVTNAGTAMTEFNAKRYSTGTAQITAFHTPTVAGGTIIIDAIIGGGTGGTSAGGVLRSGAEIILSTNTDYLLRLTNIAGNAQPAGLVIEWYEESTA